MQPNKQPRHLQSSTSELRILSANIRGFHTNVGELTHQFITKHKVDIAFVEETFLDGTVSPNYGKIPGYTSWHRKDRHTQGGGVALCFKKNLHIQLIDYPTPDNLEMLIFKYIDRDLGTILCCGCYRPPTQGPQLLEFLMENLDLLVKANNCKYVLLFGDLNQHRVQTVFDDLLAVYDLQNYVNFPTHTHLALL